MKNITHITSTVSVSFLMAVVVLATTLVGFVIVEPVVGHAINDQFTISQTVTSEISFLTTANNVTMSGALAGITGGTSNGATSVVVNTNDSAGYSMTITASATPAMQGVSQGGHIDDYTPAAANTPDFVFNVDSGEGEFAYSVSASTTADLAQKFKDNTSVCNTGSADTAGSDSCWYNLSTAATSTINRTTETPATGATTTIFFRVEIPNNPTTAIPEDLYVATTTLTALTN